jgi:cob(I)alamin adenosyltransferase
MTKGMDNSRGLVFVHTGDGKGKTTAALGLALRALGHGRKVFIAQFMKGRDYGETMAAAKYLPGLTWYKCGRESFIRKGHPAPVDIELAQKGFEVAREAVFSGKYDMVILDEINVAVDFQLIPLSAVLDLIKNKPESLYLGLTGRNASPEIIDQADLVTEMKEIKHPFSKGIPAKEGFEF